ncbi:hypothetical protein P2H44_06790 [Albimonas sp. CAU 1670]|uniref:hypothetical protein n=1 Tax=Albimonas sp. CAU 1670 TaxID=3032599 RepID=UPI0023DB245E|nr:hypothetical protein [Albimonas sp. CAU 1670]MDF2232258.1 hypothetical protein [Albimonas sp. CAU 1670]
MSRPLLILACLGLSACAAPARDYSRDIVRIRVVEAAPAVDAPAAAPATPAPAAA